MSQAIVNALMQELKANAVFVNPPYIIILKGYSARRYWLPEALDHALKEEAVASGFDLEDGPILPRLVPAPGWEFEWASEHDPPRQSGYV